MDAVQNKRTKKKVLGRRKGNHARTHVRGLSKTPSCNREKVEMETATKAATNKESLCCVEDAGASEDDDDDERIEQHVCENLPGVP